MIVSGGLETAASARARLRESGADAVMIARERSGTRGSSSELTGGRTGRRRDAEIVDELLWTMECAAEHLGPERAARYAASSTRGTWSGWASAALMRTHSSARRASIRRGICSPRAVRPALAAEPPGPELLRAAGAPRYNRAPARFRERPQGAAFGRLFRE